MSELDKAILKISEVKQNPNQKLVLIIGRGNKQGVVEQQPNTTYCYLDPNPAAFMSEQKYEVCICSSLFNLATDTRFTEHFNEIIIDGGTIHHLVYEFERHGTHDEFLNATYDINTYDQLSKISYLEGRRRLSLFSTVQLHSIDQVLGALANLSQDRVLNVHFPVEDSRLQNIPLYLKIISDQLKQQLIRTKRDVVLHETSMISAVLYDMCQAFDGSYAVTQTARQFAAKPGTYIKGQSGTVETEQSSGGHAYNTQPVVHANVKIPRPEQKPEKSPRL